MDEIRIAIVGLGMRGVEWIGTLRRLSGYRVVALCDPIEALHERALAALPDRSAVRVYSHYEDVLADGNVDAIGLTVRSRHQGALAAQGIEAGKHVNAEVPASHSIEDCWRIVLACERTGKLYQSAEQTRYWGFIEAWRKMVAEGQLGTVTFCEGQYFHHHVMLNFQERRTGRFIHPSELALYPEAEPTWPNEMPPIHYLPHELSPILRILDDRVTEVVGMSTPGPSQYLPAIGQPDVQVALMKTEKNAILRLATSFAQPHPIYRGHWYHVMGTKGDVESARRYGDLGRMWLAESQMHDMGTVDWRMERTDAPREARGAGYGGADVYPQIAFRDALLYGRPLEFDVYKAMDTAAPAILAAESIAQGSVPLKVPDFRPEARDHG